MSAKRANPKQRALDASTPMQELTNLANRSTELARLVARNTAAPETLLETLGSHSDPTVRKRVASNPNTPPTVLLKLAQQFPEQLLENPILDLLFLENPNLFAEMPVGTVRALMKRPNTPEFLIRYAMERDDEGVQLAIAQNRSTPEEIIERLKEEGNSSRVRSAAKARDEAELPIDDAEDRFWLEICNRLDEFGPQKKERVLFALLSDEDLACPVEAGWLEGWRRAKDPETAEAELYRLALSGNSLIHGTLLSRKQLPSSVEITVAACASPKHQIKLAEKVGSSEEILRVLALSRDWEVRKAVAENPGTPPQDLAHLAKDGIWNVRIGVAGNPSTPSRMLSWLAKQNRPDEPDADAPGQEWSDYWDTYFALNQLAATLASNPSTPISNFESLAVRYVSARQGLAKNPLTPASVLELLSKDDDVDVRIYVAWHANTPSKVLKRLAKDRTPGGFMGIISPRSEAAGNPTTPTALLIRLAKDEACRFKVARNESAPMALLRTLSRDSDPDVRRAAIANLRNR